MKSHLSSTELSIHSLTSTSNTDSHAVEPWIARLEELVSRKKYLDAVAKLRAAPPSVWARNALAVCLMRSGRAEEAVQIYRSLLLNPGTTVMRSDADDLLKVNFATALAISGRPSGAMDVLAELDDPDREPAVKLRQAIQRWSTTLSMWRRWDWKLNAIDPPNSMISMDFEPGVFALSPTARQPNSQDSGADRAGGIDSLR